jgi:hypothetical protein
MDAGTALAALQSWCHWSAGSWFGLVVGVVCGVPTGMLAAKVLGGRRRPRQQRSGFLHDLLALTPAIVACLLWGAWLGIMAAKFAP